MTTKFIRKNPIIHLHKDDLPERVLKENAKQIQVAIDTETTGLSYTRDRLCLIQLTFDSENCHLIQINPENPEHKAPNLVKLLSSDITKIFHFARFDVGILYSTFGIMTENIFCTKIASKLARTYTERHGLKTICSELLQVEICKKEQSSDWGKEELTQEQQNYAAMDVMFLAPIKEILENMLKRESRLDLAYECFSSLPCIVKLECLGWQPESLFAHL